MNSPFSQAWNHKGKVLFNLKRFNESYNLPDKSFDKAIELDRKSVKAWEGKGEALKALHRDTEAYQAFAKAKELG